MDTSDLPPHPKIVSAAIELLKTLPDTWAAIPELSHVNEQALALLTVVGLVERQRELRLRAAGEDKAVVTKVRFHGQTGLSQAIEVGTVEAYKLLGVEHTRGLRYYVEMLEGLGEWRLTAYGLEAQAEATSGDVCYLKDVLRTPPVPGVLPSMFIPGFQRWVINGAGRVVNVKVVDTVEPVHVHVDNFDEISVPIQDLKQAMANTTSSPTPTKKPMKKVEDIVSEVWRIAQSEPYSKQNHSESKLAKRVGCARDTIRKALGKVPDVWCPAIGRIVEWRSRPGSKAEGKTFIHNATDLAARLKVKNQDGDMIFDRMPDHDAEDPTALIFDADVETHFRKIRELAQPAEQAKLDLLDKTSRRALVATCLMSERYSSRLPDGIKSRRRDVDSK